MGSTLGDSMWKWPLPIRSSMDGNGYYFPTIPEVEQTQAKIEEEKQLGDVIYEPDSKISKEELQKYIQECLQEYQAAR